MTQAEMLRKHPLAHRDGILLFAALVEAGMQMVRVECQGVDTSCGWQGKRRLASTWGNDVKPCPRCGSSIAVRKPR